MLSTPQFLMYNILDVKRFVLALGLLDNYYISHETHHWGLGTQTTITNQDIFKNLDYQVFDINNE